MTTVNNSDNSNDFPEEKIESITERLLRFRPKAIETVRKVGRVSIKQRIEFDKG